MELKKKSTSASLKMLKPLIVCITTIHGKFLNRWEYQTTSPTSGEICMHDKKQHLKPHMEKWTASKWGKEYAKATNFHHAYST